MSFDLAAPNEAMFDSYSDLCDSLQAHAGAHGYAVAKTQSKTNPAKIVRIIYLQCVKAGKPKDRGKVGRCKPFISQKTDCPFRCRAKMDITGSWILTVDNPRHNHMPNPPIAHHQHRKLAEPVRQIVCSITAAGSEPKDISSALSHSHSDLIFTMQDIYNKYPLQFLHGTTQRTNPN
jgi:hypothetical protein